MVQMRVRLPSNLLAVGAIAAGLLAATAPARADDVFGRIGGWWDQGPSAEVLCASSARKPARLQVTDQRRKLVAERSLLPPELAGSLPEGAGDPVFEVEGSGWNKLVLRPTTGDRESRWEVVMVRPDVFFWRAAHWEEGRFVGAVAKRCASLQPVASASARPAAAPSGDARASAIEQAQWLARAMHAQDSDTIVAMTDPIIFATWGMEPDEVADAHRARARDMKRQGVEIESVTLGEASAVFQRADRHYVFVPYTAIGNGSRGRHEVNLFLIGASQDGGRHWHFVDGSRVDDAFLKLYIAGWDGTPALPRRAVRRID